MPLKWIFVAGLAFPPARASAQTCTPVGTNRWAVKTMAPASASQARTFDASAFAKLPAPPDFGKKGQRKLDARYSSAIESGLHEGDLVSLTGWVQFIKTSDDDCDYHLQVTPNRAGKGGTIIVEIPQPDAAHVNDAQLRARLAALRASVLSQLGLTQEPPAKGVWIAAPVYMEFTGALFFDGNNYPKCGLRGKRVAAVTCWEVHPVVSARTLPPPAAQ